MGGDLILANTYKPSEFHMILPKVLRIDLGDYRLEGRPVFTREHRGQEVRKAADLDRLDQTDGEVHVILPEDAYAFSSSFFSGMFGDSVRALGEDAFRKKYHFSGPNVDIIVEDGIREEARSLVNH